VWPSKDGMLFPSRLEVEPEELDASAERRCLSKMQEDGFQHQVLLRSWNLVSLSLPADQSQNTPVLPHACRTRDTAIHDSQSLCAMNACVSDSLTWILSS